MSKLYVIPTPIGNLDDVSRRAVKILKEVDIIFAEDTRVSGRLLLHLEIDNNLKPFHKDNEHKVLERYVEMIENSNSVAVISDAGTPGISDPGFLLVRECIKAGIIIETLPGPTAFLPALINSGFPTDRFIYEGFVPHKKGRQTLIESWLHEERTIVCYESPHRLIKLLTQLEDILGTNRHISVSREITKKFEETTRGTTTEVRKHFGINPIKGEFVVVISGAKFNGY